MNFLQSGEASGAKATTPKSSVWGRKRGIEDLVAKVGANDASLESLHIMSTRKFDDQGAKSLCTALSKNTNLTELYASGHTLGFEGISEFSKLLHGKTGLAYLSIGCSKFGGKGLQILSEGLANNDGLKSLNLEYKGLDCSDGSDGAEGVRALSAALRNNSALEELLLSRNPLGDEGVSILLRGLSGSHSRLRSLVLSDVGVGMDGMLVLGRTLQTRPSLSSVDISNNGLVGAAGCAAFAAAGGFSNMAVLNISGCNIGNEGASMVARAVAQQGSPSTLKLRNNGITAKGAVELANALKLSKIAELDLSNNRVGPHTAALFAAMSGLKQLGLLGNRLGNEGCQTIAESIIFSTKPVTLEYLDLCGNGISDDGVVSICSIFSAQQASCASFKTIVVGSNPIGQKGEDEIVETLINNPSLRFVRDRPATGDPDEAEEENDGAALPNTTEPTPFTYHLSPHESSRVGTAVRENFSTFFFGGHADDYKTHAHYSRRAAPDFVWIHTPTKNDEEIRAKSLVVSLLSGIDVLENKGSLALLSSKINAPMLQSHVIKGKLGFRAWCKRKFGADGSSSASESWIAKDSSANGGEGLFPFCNFNWNEVTDRLGANAEYVLQQYVDRPMLWEGKFKFHFRAYCVLRADMSFYCYRRAFAHVCNKPYRSSVESVGNGKGGSEGSVSHSYFDREIHISNVAANVHNEDHFHNYPVVDLPSEYPAVWEKMEHIFSGVIEAAGPFMKYQLSKNNFMLIGADLLPDEDGGVWLLEMNCPPCMSAYQGKDEEHLKLNKFEQAIRPLVSAVVRDLINDFVLPPLFSDRYGNKTVPGSKSGEIHSEHHNFEHAKSGNYIRLLKGNEDNMVQADGVQDLAKNGLSWKVFKWRNGKKASKQ